MFKQRTVFGNIFLAFSLAFTVAAKPAKQPTAPVDKGPLAANRFDIKAERTVVIQGPIFGNALKTVGQLEALIKDGRKPIYILINSPGGRLDMGQRIGDLLDEAKERGVKVKCLVIDGAMSAAFHILMHCGERYAFENSMLLFHQVRVGIGGGKTEMVGEDDFRFVADDLKKANAYICESLKSGMGVTQEFIDVYLKKDFVWTAKELIYSTNNKWLKTVKQEDLEVNAIIQALMEDAFDQLANGGGQEGRGPKLPNTLAH